MKRSPAPKRKTPLKRGAPPKRKTPIRRSKVGAAWATPRTEPKKRRTKTERQKMMKEADRLFSLIVRSRGRCELQLAVSCRDKGEWPDGLFERDPAARYETAHIVRRRYLRVRFDEANALCSCRSCHISAHNNELRFELRVIELRGEETFSRLKRDALDGPKLDLPATLEQLRERARQLGLD